MKLPVKYRKLTPRRWVYDISSDKYLCPYCSVPVVPPDEDPGLLPDFCPVCCLPVSDLTVISSTEGAR